MIRNVFVLAATLLLSILIAGDGHAHGGRLAADGCHNDRKLGVRHCHPERAGGSSQNSRQSTSPNPVSGDCSEVRYNRRSWSFRGRKYNTSTGYYSGLQCSKIDADHVVSLKDAHDSGGCAWSSAQKRQFSNDSENLVPTCAHINRSKGARLPGSFIRSASDGRGIDFIFSSGSLCGYLEIYKKVKDKYGLSYQANDLAVFSRCDL